MVVSRSPIIDKVDRKLAFSFGALVLVLMLLVTATSSYLFIRLQSQEEDRLSGALARIIAESVSKVSFSGTYHARLFVEEIAAKTPEIHSAALIAKDGRIIAHSNPARNGDLLTGDDLALIRQCLAQNSTVVGERYRNGGKEKIIVLPYAGGIDAETLGVIRLVVDVAKVHREQRVGIVTMVVIATLLSCVAVMLILLLSRYFGSAVKEVAMQLQAILDNSPALIYVKDRTGHYQFVNQAWCNLFQTVNDNVKGKTDLELFPEETARQFMRNDQLVMQSDTQLTLEEQLPMNEEIRYYHSIKVAVRDTNGATYGLCGISTDISERKKAEETLRESEERLQLATQAAGIGIWDWDVVTNTLLWDESMYRLYGIQREDFNGAYEAWFRCIHPDDAGLTDHAIQAALSGEKEYAPEFRIVRPDGAVRLIQAAAKTFRDLDGKPLRMIGINLDITELKQAEEQIRLLNEQLEQRVQERTAELMERGRELQENQRALMNIVDDLNQKTEELEQANTRMQELDQLKSLFIASMSHELRTPLNSIIGFSSILKDEWLGPVNQEQKDNLATILRSGKHLLNLINDVIDVSKIEAGKIEIRFEEFDLYDLLKEAVQYVENEIREKGLQLELQLLHCQLRTDRRRLLQSVLNLLSNAVKFTEQGSVTLSMSAETVQPGKPGCIAISVTDTGIGISEEDLVRLFKPFVRLESPLQTLAPGTGLGLYLTKKLIEDVLGGSISCSSTLGKGSTFTLRIQERFYEKGTGSRG